MPLGGFGSLPVSALLLDSVILANINATRRKKKEEDNGLLTPETLNLQRKRHIWSATLFYGGLMSVFMIGATWATMHTLGFMIFVIAVCLGGGYVFALVTWEWKKSLLQSRDYERRRAKGGV